MSYCGECEACHPGPVRDKQPLTLAPTPAPAPREELEQMLAELKGLRLGARELKRSGNPAVRAEGVKALAHIEDQIRWVRGQLEAVDA